MIKIKHCDMVTLNTEDLNDDIVVCNCRQVILSNQKESITDEQDEISLFGNLTRKDEITECINKDINKNPFKIAYERIISILQEENPCITIENATPIITHECIRLCHILITLDNPKYNSNTFVINESDSLEQKLYKILRNLFPDDKMKDDVLRSVDKITCYLNIEGTENEIEASDNNMDDVDKIRFERKRMIIERLKKLYPRVPERKIAEVTDMACNHIYYNYKQCCKDVGIQPIPINLFELKSSPNISGEIMTIFKSLYPDMPIYVKKDLISNILNIMDKEKALYENHPIKDK